MKYIRIKFDDLKLYSLALFFSILFIEPSFAQDPTVDFSGMTAVLTAITDALTGDLGTAIAILAVIAIGFTFLMGKMDWMFATTIVLGIAIVFGGAVIAEGLSTSSGTTGDGTTTTDEESYLLPYEEKTTDFA